MPRAQNSFGKLARFIVAYCGLLARADCDAVSVAIRALRFEFVQLEQKDVDRTQLRIGQVLGIEQLMKPLAPVGGRQNGPREISGH